MQNYPISFGSIRLVSANKFAKEIADIPAKNYVHIWTVDGIVTSEKPYTDKIYDCVTTGVMNKEKVTMVHISPYYRRNNIEAYKQNENFSKIGNALLNSFGGSIKGLDSIVLGNKSTFPESNALLEKAISFLQEHGANISVISGLKADTTSSVIGDVGTQSWIITNDYISGQLKKGVQNLKGILERCFQNINIPKEVSLIRN